MKTGENYCLISKELSLKELSFNYTELNNKLNKNHTGSSIKRR